NRCGEYLPEIDRELSSVDARVRRLLPQIPGPDCCLATTRFAAAAGVRLGARQHDPGAGNQSLPGHGINRRLSDFGLQSTTRLRLVFCTRRIVDLSPATCRGELRYALNH